MSDELDRLIDDVAGEMTSAPAREGLARRVAARIAGEGERRPWFRPWVMAPIAAACVVVVAVFVARDGGKAPDVTTVAQAPIVERPFEGRGRIADAREGRSGRDPERVALQRVALLPVVEPIEVDRLDVQPLVEMDVIQIIPIAIDRIEISAMP